MAVKPNTNPDTIQKYLTDESNIFHADQALVKAVYFPQTPDEVAEVICLANQEKTLCTVSGGGTGITGSRVPVHGGLVLSTEKMIWVQVPEGWDTIKKDTLLGPVCIGIKPQNKLALVPPGISLDVLSQVLPAEFFYPPDPTESTALIGGTIAANASGARSFRYGATRAWVHTLDLVLPDGECLHVERGQVIADSNRQFKFTSQAGKEYAFDLPRFDSPDMKNAAGLYVRSGMDSVDLFVGSEGIFGVITAAQIKLEPKPEEILGNTTFFGNQDHALAYVKELRSNRDKGIVAIEFFDFNSLVFMREHHPNVEEGFKAAIYTEISNPTEEAMEWLVELAEAHQAQGDWFADNPREMQKLKEFRHSLPEGVNSYLKQKQSSKLGTDFVVPEHKFDEMMQAYQDAGKTFQEKFPRDGVYYVLFGHIGDYHIHCNFITSSKEEQAFAKDLYLSLAEKAISLGGTISGEHGVGKKIITQNGKETPYLELMLGQKAMQEIAAVKKVFDPKLILNVGNIVGREYLF